MMKIRTSWPWIVALLSVVAALTPFGIAVVSAAFTGEQLARMLGLLLFGVGIVMFVLFALIEFGIRKYLMARQRRRAMSA